MPVTLSATSGRRPTDPIQDSQNGVNRGESQAALPDAARPILHIMLAGGSEVVGVGFTALGPRPDVVQIRLGRRLVTARRATGVPPPVKA
jgi:hypothetical protein